jgi:hypothetical protein
MNRERERELVECLILIYAWVDGCICIKGRGKEERIKLIFVRFVMI